jgi:Asp/Glu/hydantoin racemase
MGQARAGGRYPPVVGLGESTMHLACQLGRKFALAMPTGMPGGVALAEEAIKR